MDNNLFQRLKELVEANQSVGIVLPSNPSFDTAAAGLGLFLALRQMKKNASIVCPTDVTVGVSSLVGIDKVQKSFGAGGGNDLIVSFPYKEGEIEKVSYNVDGGKLQIVVKAGSQGLSFSQSDVSFQRGGDAGTGTLPSLLFFIGVADMQQLGFSKTPGITVVNIDNRSQNTKYGDAIHVDSKFSSISEEIADFLTLLEPQIELDVDTSQNLLSGILSATDNFQGGRGSYLAFEMAGILMKKGAKRGVVGQAPAPAMPAANYFPPAPSAVPAQQPGPQANQPLAEVQQLQQVFQPQAPSFVQPVQQEVPVQAPVQQAPVEPVQSFNSAQGQGPAQSVPNATPPADWLTPKVYKGSSVI